MQASFYCSNVLLYLHHCTAPTNCLYCTYCARLFVSALAEPLFPLSLAVTRCHQLEALDVSGCICFRDSVMKVCTPT
jgi:hypothetical protein